MDMATLGTPRRRLYLGKEEAKEKNQAREDHLKPNGDAPAQSPLNMTGFPWDKSSGDATTKPQYIVKTCHGTPESRMSNLWDICWTSRNRRRDSKAQEKPTTHERSQTRARSLNNGPNDDEQRA